MESRITIFVEGIADEDFFEYVIKPLLTSKYARIEIILHGETKDKIIANHIKARRELQEDIIYVEDMDKPVCIRKKKEQIQARLPELKKTEIIIVIREIESWYYSGINLPFKSKYKVTTRKSEEMTQGRLQECCKKSSFRCAWTLYRRDILENYNYIQAIERNQSLAYINRIITSM